MQKPVHMIIFSLVSIILRIRDVFYPPKYILKDVEIRPGSCVLDFGCGPGSYSIATAELLSGTGKVFALDMHPAAIKKVNQTAQKKKLSNIRTILSDCDTGLESDSVDVVLLYYIFNDLRNPEKVLAELYRVLKPEGILSFSEYNVKKISPRLEKKEFFVIKKRDEITHTFLKMPLVVN